MSSPFPCSSMIRECWCKKIEIEKKTKKEGEMKARNLIQISGNVLNNFVCLQVFLKHLASFNWLHRLF